MATDPITPGFYRELDKRRHSPGCGWLFGVFIVGLIALAVIWYVLDKYYL